MIERLLMLRPWQTGDWQDLTAAIVPAARRALATTASALARLSVWLAAAAEPLLDWLARRRWLGGLFGSVTGKIVFLNLLGLLGLTLAMLFFSPIQASLVAAKLDGLISESEVIAGSITSSTTRESDRLVLDPSAMEPGHGADLRRALGGLSLSFPINTQRVESLIHRVADGGGLRVRLFRPDGAFMYDSEDQPERTSKHPDQPQIKTFWTELIDAFDGTSLPVYRDLGRANPTAYPEVKDALNGVSKPLILVSDRGSRSVTIASPLKRDGILGVMLLSTRYGEIDKLVWAERKTVLWLGFAGLVMMTLTSLLLAGTIALPLQRLADAAGRVQLNLKRREDLPDFDQRGDEVGNLSKTLRSMTEALYKRIEASERFAADVAHELKNPLTSVRSAAETLPRVKNEADRKLLTDTIQNDVKRLTRLIDDISKATRADAEMALNVAEPVDVVGMLQTLAEVFNNVHVQGGQTVVTDIAPCGLPMAQAFSIQGHDIRLGQVFKNLLDNALSFSPPEGRVWIKASRTETVVQIAIEDEGPGIPGGNFEKIFNRFYTDRPVGSFGNNSGLGLSICKEIVAAHGGKIWAENRVENTVQRSGNSDLGVVTSAVAGARFIVELPATVPLNGADRYQRVKAYGQR